MRPRFAVRGWMLVTGAVVLTAGVTALGASARPTEPAPAPAVTAPIKAAIRLCPTTASPVVAGTVTSVSAATLPEVSLPAAVSTPSMPSDGVRLMPLSGSHLPLTSVTAAGAQSTYTPTGGKGLAVPTELSAQGTLAPGAAAGQVTYVPTGPHRALLGSACPAPTGNAWFVGGSGGTGRLTTVELDNPDTTPAVADIVVYGERGQVEAPAGRGVTVPPHGVVTRRLDVLSPGTADAAVHVILREGRAAVTVTDGQSSGLLPKGADVISATAPPAKRLIIPGVPGGTTGSRMLQILAPGDQDALVQVQVLGRNGRFTPDNLAALGVPAGSVAQAELAPQVADGSVGLSITSDVPIVAAVRNIITAPTGSPDVTYSVATHSLHVPVLAAGLRTAASWTTWLLLAAPSGDGRATVTLLNADGTSSTATVSVTGGTSSQLVLHGSASFAAVVTPAANAGQVFGAVLLQYRDKTGPLATQWPLVGAPLTVTLPPVRADPALGVPGG